MLDAVPEPAVCPSAGAPGLVRPALFTIDSLPPGCRLDAWNAQFGSLNDIAPREDSPALLSCQTEHWLLGDMLLSICRASPSCFTRSPRHLRRDGLDHWFVRMLLTGSCRVRQGEATYAMTAGVPFVLRLDRAWDATWDDASWISVCVPQHAHADLSAAFALHGPGPVEGAGSRLLASYLLTLERQVRTVQQSDTAILANATRAMLAACLARDAHPARLGAEDLAPAMMERIRALIRQHMHSPSFGPQRLATLSGMSRSALYRLLEGQGGVAHVIQGMRLRRAMALLSDPALASEPIASLAERAGFFDPSAFSRAFRAAYGSSPREARMAALAGRPPAPLGAAGGGDFGVLLRGIGLGRLPRLSGGGAPGRVP
jgi:AraC-like DNA-binding protein